MNIKLLGFLPLAITLTLMNIYAFKGWKKPYWESSFGASVVLFIESIALILFWIVLIVNGLTWAMSK